MLGRGSLAAKMPRPVHMGLADTWAMQARYTMVHTTIGKHHESRECILHSWIWNSWLSCLPHLVQASVCISLGRFSVSFPSISLVDMRAREIHLFHFGEKGLARDQQWPPPPTCTTRFFSALPADSPIGTGPFPCPSPTSRVRWVVLSR